MSFPSSPAVHEEVQTRPEELSPLRLHGHWLTAARLGWSCLVIASLTIFVVSLPAYYEQLRTLSGPDMGNPDEVREGLDQLGLSSRAFAIYILSLEVAATCVFIAVALIIASRKLHERIGLIISLALITFATTFSRAPQAFIEDHSSWSILVKLLALFGFVAFFSCF